MAKTSESGMWDQDPSGSGAGSTFVKRTPGLKQVAKVVRDDWDDDDDEEEEAQVEGGTERDVNRHPQVTAGGTRKDGTAAPGAGPSGREAEEHTGEDDSSKIWAEANKRAPMPELIVARASTSQSFPPPPLAALQPTLRILKRPSPNTSANSAAPSSPGPPSGSSSSSGSGGTSPAPRGTLAEREAQYQEARSRIFGEKETLVGVVVVRDPLGLVPEPAPGPGMSTSGQDKGGPDGPAKGFGERRGRKDGI